MERGCGIAVLLLVSGTTFSKETLLECGTQTSNGFNGWSLSPFAAFSAVEFKDETVAFYVKDGGEYTLNLTRKIETMRDFAQMDFNIRFDRFENCVLNFVDVYASEDGRIWKALDVDQSDFSGVINNAGNYQFIRIAANVSFFRDGFIECSYFKLESDDPVSLESVTAPEPVVVKEFFVFCFNKSINVETQSELAYEVVFTNLAGQVVYRESSVGSTRVVSELPEGVYIISIVQNNHVVETKKVIF